MIEQKVTAWLSAGAAQQMPKRIIVHAMAEYVIYQGKAMHAVDFLKAVGLSAHSLITPSGVNIRCREDNQGAYHAKGFNTDSLGIEFLVPGVHDYASFIDVMENEYYMTDPAYLTGLSQVREWATLYNIELIDRHSDLDPQRKQDPGSKFPFNALVEAALA